MDRARAKTNSFASVPFTASPMDQSDELLWAQQQWQQGGTIALQTASEAELTRFAQRYHVQLPAELVRYFTLVNGTAHAYDERFFRFYSLAEVQSVAERFDDYHGLPKYSDLMRTWPEHKQFYVVADYMIHLLAYAIRLDAQAFSANPVFVLCGDKYQQVATSFTEFLTLYKRDAAELYMSEEEVVE
ncbi:SMI1/KNR4 family protein [Hymenobacter canadensis]|uniref:SMI1/KNR4 family protein n=1 Tax=Hymenobacter canadensis TaxID=2999067 RepID=A0ABY7LV18_9BACT|nr:SMI1/KNR4 family protein [Hymenobacter canadensis]WBA44187.1 SMI1/KNR4 family protein [Hymenobacter canadensis]WBA44226.1 SMI1/KNR4 family protein [Hymenobacter canadensis]